MLGVQTGDMKFRMLYNKQFKQVGPGVSWGNRPQVTPTLPNQVENPDLHRHHPGRDHLSRNEAVWLDREHEELADNIDNQHTAENDAKVYDISRVSCKTLPLYRK